MTTPPFALAAAIVLWAWQSGQWLVAAGVLALVEGARLARRRFHFAAEDFNRVADFCTVIAAAAAVLLYLSYGNPRAITTWFQWLPLMVLPLVAMQAWSDTREFSLAVLFWSLRRQQTGRRAAAGLRARGLNLGYPWFAAWVLAASAANTRQVAFYFAAAAAGGAVLWTLRPGGRRSAAWLVVMSLALGTGYAAQFGLHRLQIILEDYVPAWMSTGGARTDPYSSRTHLGQLGELKQSGRIQLRVAATLPDREALLLHRASYNDYRATTWVARGAPFETYTPAAGTPAAGEAALERKTAWSLLPGVEPQSSLVVHDYSQQGNPLLALPAGTVRIEGLSATELRHNRLGSVQIENLPGIFSYRALYRAGTGIDAPPGEEDLLLPREEQFSVLRLAAALSLAGRPPADAVARIGALFAENYRYAIWQPAERSTAGARGGAGEGSALSRFLDETRAGHCEYFATATVLLLRAAGIPARYATGFSVREFSPLEELYVVRQRHAHAWASAWIDGSWQDIDTTPADWFAAEQAAAAPWSRAADLWSFLAFTTQRRIAALSENQVVAGAVALALLLALWLAWRLFAGRDTTVRAVAAADAGRARPVAGEDSSFYAVQQRLAALAGPRLASETLPDWLQRIDLQLPDELDRRLLSQALDLHYRYRFDPRGLASAERALLTRQSTLLIGQIEASATRAQTSAA